MSSLKMKARKADLHVLSENIINNHRVISLDLPWEVPPPKKKKKTVHLTTGLKIFLKGYNCPEPTVDQPKTKLLKAILPIKFRCVVMEIFCTNTASDPSEF